MQKNNTLEKEFKMEEGIPHRIFHYAINTMLHTILNPCGYICLVIF